MNTNETSAIVRWEAFKAYIRGMIISYTSSKTNKLKLQMNELDHRIRRLEREAYLDDSVKIQQELTSLKAQYEELSTKKTENSLIKVGQYQQTLKRLMRSLPLTTKHYTDLNLQKTWTNRMGSWMAFLFLP